MHYRLQVSRDTLHNKHGLGENMKIYMTGPDGDLILQKGRSIVVEFEHGQTLELAGNQSPLPPEIPDGFELWGGRIPTETSRDVVTSRLNITPVAANGITVSPYNEATSRAAITVISVADDDGNLTPLTTSTAVLELANGKTVEVMEDYGQKGLLIWGGREPNPVLAFEEIKARTECLGLYPIAANVVHIFTYKLASD